MPSAEIIILKTPIVYPDTFIIIFIIAITAKYGKFIGTKRTVILSSDFKQFFNWYRRTHRGPAVITVTTGWDMIKSLTIPSVGSETTVWIVSLQCHISHRIVCNTGNPLKMSIFNIAITLGQQSYRIFVLKLAQILIPRAIFVAYRLGRITASGLTVCDSAETSAVNCRLAPVRASKQTETQTYLVIKQPLRNLYTGTKVLEIRTLHYTLTGGIIKIGHVIGAACASGEWDIMHMAYRSTGYLINPIGIVAIVIVRVKLSKLSGAEHFMLSWNLGCAYISAIVNLEHLCSPGLFGSYKYNSVGAARTINSGGRTVFQHINTLHIFRCHRIKVTRYSINKYKRCCIGTSYRTGATQTYLRIACRIPWRIGNRKAGNFALNELSYIFYSSFNKIFRFDTCNRTCNIRFTLCTIADYNDFFKIFAVFNQFDDKRISGF